MPDFVGDQGCVTHHACACIQARCDRYRALLARCLSELLALEVVAGYDDLEEDELMKDLRRALEGPANA